MGDVIDFNKDHGIYDRSCGECGCSIFTWHTSQEDEDSHVLMCVDCDTAYSIFGEEVE